MAHFEMHQSQFLDFARAEATRLGAAFAHLPVWGWATDSNLIVTVESDRLERWTGIAPERRIGKPLLAVGRAMRMMDRSANVAVLDRLADHAEVELTPFVTVLHGQPTVMALAATPYFDEQGAFLGYIGLTLWLRKIEQILGQTPSGATQVSLCTDAALEILEKNAVAAQDAQALLQEIVDAMGEGLMVTSGTDVEDPENSIVLTNPAYRSMFDLKANQARPGTKLKDFTQSVAENGIAFENLDAVGDVNDALARGESVLMRLHRTNRSLYVKATHRPTGGYVLVHTDVTDLEAQNTALRVARDAAEVANRTKSNFLATMSHEFRTPMNGIVGMVDLLEGTQLCKEQREYLRTIRSSALALTSLITDILDFSKIEAGHLAIHPEPFLLADMLDKTVGILQPLARQKGIDLSLHTSPGVAPKLVGDALRLRQILLNLIGNAVKFTETGGVSLSVRPSNVGAFQFEVSDTGIGMDAEELQRAFQPFEQIESGFHRQYEGTGLGLAISRRLAEAMGGTLTATSARGQGSRFVLDIPMEIGQGASDPKAQQAPAVDALTGCRVLVVEDNQTNQLVVRRLLEKAGAQVSTAGNGRDALEILRRAGFDVALMDMSMPVMDGLTTTREIRTQQTQQRLRHLPVICLSGNAFERDRNLAKEAGMDDFLSKPVRRDDLIACVARHWSDAKNIALAVKK